MRTSPKLGLVAFSCVVAMLACTFASAQQVVVDPQSLIGQWVGRWEFGRAGGEYYLTITRLENGIYYGTAQYTGAESNQPQTIVGKLEGDIFKYSSNVTGTAELKADGDKMAGTGAGRVATGIKLSVEKKH